MIIMDYIFEYFKTILNKYNSCIYKLFESILFKISESKRHLKTDLG